jgi:hypothetical protein
MLWSNHRTNIIWRDVDEAEKRRRGEYEAGVSLREASYSIFDVHPHRCHVITP